MEFFSVLSNPAGAQIVSCLKLCGQDMDWILLTLNFQYLCNTQNKVKIKLQEMIYICNYKMNFP